MALQVSFMIPTVLYKNKDFKKRKGGSLMAFKKNLACSLQKSVKPKGFKEIITRYYYVLTDKPIRLAF